MPNRLPLFANVLWIGGTSVLGALVAPGLFRVLKASLVAAVVAMLIS
jgi:hypothetical protein